MKPREALFSVQAVDEINSNGYIIAKMTTIDDTDEGEIVKKCLPSNFELPDLSQGTERCDFGGIALFRLCPTDHPNYKAMRSKFPNGDLILTQFMVTFDAKMTMVPKSMINFVTRTALGTVWTTLLRVAEQVQDGSREEHCKIINQKADFYKWVEKRCNFMLHERSYGHENCANGEPNRESQHKVQQHHHLRNKQWKVNESEIWTLQEILRMNM
jgi:hypothetical protein